MDGRVHVARGFEKHGNVSGWDIYRGQQQLVAMLDPPRAGRSCGRCWPTPSRAAASRGGRWSPRTPTS
jgi:hypothetical protein